jgi:hypothetical protein
MFVLGVARKVWVPLVIPTLDGEGVPQDNILRVLIDIPKDRVELSNFNEACDKVDAATEKLSLDGKVEQEARLLLPYVHDWKDVYAVDDSGTRHPLPFSADHFRLIMRETQFASQLVTAIVRAANGVVDHRAKNSAAPVSSGPQADIRDSGATH